MLEAVSQQHVFLRTGWVAQGGKVISGCPRFPLVSVSTHKTVLSQEIRTGLFRYVSLNRLAEMEAGVTTNEPIYTCVLQAIQKAVVGLVIEGIQHGVWALKDPADTDAPVIREYLNEKNDSLQRLVSERSAVSVEQVD